MLKKITKFLVIFIILCFTSFTDVEVKALDFANYYDEFQYNITTTTTYEGVKYTFVFNPDKKVCLIEKAEVDNSDVIIKLPSSATRLENGVKVKYTVVGIGDKVFFDCSSIQEVYTPSTITFIGTSAFESCTNLTKVELSENIDILGDYSFRNTGIENISLPNRLKYIGWAAFSGSALTEIAIPDSVEVISQSAFSYCSSLGKVVFGKGLSEIYKLSFGHCYSLKVIEIPNSVKRINEQAFAYSGIVDIAIPDSVTRVDESAFDYSDLETIQLGNALDNESITNILNSLINFRFIVIPYGVSAIDADLQNAVEYMYIPETVSRISLDIKPQKIIGIAGSYAETYANMAGIPFEESSKKVSNFKIINTPKSLNIAESHILRLSIEPQAIGQKVTWSSSDNSVATVNRDGYVFAKSSGLVNITATIGDKSRTVCIKVNSPEDSSEETTDSNQETSTEKPDEEETTKPTEKPSENETTKPTEKPSADIVNKKPLVSLEKDEDGYYLTWDKIADQYEIYRGDVSDYYTYVAFTTTTKYYIPDTTTPNIQKYKVRGFNLSEQEYSQFSDIVTYTVKPKTVKNLKQKSTYTNKIEMGWSKVPDVTGYEIWRANTKNAKYSKVLDVKTNTGKYYVTGGSAYWFKVRAYKELKDGSRIYGDYSATTKLYSKPSTPTFKLTKAGGTKIKVSWDKSVGANMYEIYMSTSKTGTYKLVTTRKSTHPRTYTISKLTKGKAYYFKIRTYKVDGNGGKIYSNWSTIKYFKLNK